MMDNFSNMLTAIEVIAIGVIILLQIRSFFRTKSKIKELGDAIPDVNDLAVTRIEVPVGDLNALSPQEILDRRHLYMPGSSPTVEVPYRSAEPTTDAAPGAPAGGDEVSESVGSASDARMRFTIIEGPNDSSSVFTKTLAAINTYILSNRTGTADFSLIKDVTERNTDAIEEEVHLTVSAPLFLGLMGTMLGIVISLIKMGGLVGTGAGSGTNSDSAMSSGITALLVGVSIAMIASFVGLLLTTVNSSVFQKSAKATMDRRKGEFFTFLQTSLLPVIDQGLGASLHSLQKNLAEFNAEFRINLNGMNQLFGKFADGLGHYKDLIESLEKINLKKIATFNVDVLGQLDKSLDAITQFKEHLELVNTGVERADMLIERFDRMLTRTDDVSKIAERIEGTVSDGRDLMAYLTAHKETLEKFEQNTRNAIADTGGSISDAFKELERHIAASIEQIKSFTVDEAAILKDAIADGRVNLGNLAFLENINDVLRAIRDKADKPQTASIEAKLDALKTALMATNQAIAKVEQRVAESGGRRGILSYLSRS